MAKSLNGACHCGAIGVVLEVEDASALSPRHCGCSFCVKHGSLYVSAPSGRLTITLAAPDLVSRYASATRPRPFSSAAAAAWWPRPRARSTGASTRS